jgi:hypothetical protein
MGFSWADTLTSNITLEKFSHLTELRTNINTVRGQVGLGGYSWTSIPQYATDSASNWLELRTALDEANNSTYCHAVNAANYGDCGGYNGGYNGVCGCK